MPPPRRLGRPPLTASQRQESDRRNAERHAAYMRERRSDPEYRQLEQAANTQQRARARQDDQYREREQAARNQARQDEEYRSRERSMDAQRRARARQDNEYRRREQEANTQQRALARQDDQYRQHEQAADTQRRALARQDGEYRRREQEANTQQHREARAEGLAQYRAKIKEGPTHTCNCCGNLWFKHSIKKKPVAWFLAKGLTPEFFERCCPQQFRLSRDEVQLCGTCFKKVSAGVQPALCYSTYSFPPVPPELQDLKPLEERMVATRLPFMQIRSLGVDGQYGLRGSVVNVPLSVNDSVIRLPRRFNETYTVQVRLMRQMSNRRPYMYETIRPFKVFQAARYVTANSVSFSNL